MHILILVFLFLFSFSPKEASARLDPRLKAVLSMSGFGFVGGALLGMASKTFGNQDSFGRATARGASLGLYAGILFGSYVAVGHYLEKYEGNDFEDDAYLESNIDSYGGGGGWIEKKYSPFNGRERRFWPGDEELERRHTLGRGGRVKHDISLFYLPLFYFQF